MNTIDKETLFQLYITQNKSMKDLAALFKVSQPTIGRWLRSFGLKKPKELRLTNVSTTKQNKTAKERTEYSKHISEARKGKGLGLEPWNKGKHTGNAWLGRKHSEETKKKISETQSNKTAEERAEITKKRLTSRIYGDPWNKGKELSTETKNKLRKRNLDNWKRNHDKYIEERNNTHRKNKSFVSSKPEDKYYEKLCEKYGNENVIRQYTDPRYPYNCDFYIKSEDLFVELNLNWTHGDKLFENTEEDIKKLNIWKQKALKSNFYKNAIETWTVRDVEKNKMAKENNLNYMVYYNENELEL